jgi:hypothetical protein
MNKCEYRPENECDECGRCVVDELRAEEQYFRVKGKM